MGELLGHILTHTYTHTYIHTRIRISIIIERRAKSRRVPKGEPGLVVVRELVGRGGEVLADADDEGQDGAYGVVPGRDDGGVVDVEDDLFFFLMVKSVCVCVCIFWGYELRVTFCATRREPMARHWRMTTTLP
jgi:hypothetical protein